MEKVTITEMPSQELLERFLGGLVGQEVTVRFNTEDSKFEEIPDVISGNPE